MALLADFKQVVADFADIADFVTIYISEAHATNQWNFPGNKYKIKKHNSLQDRLLAASILLDDEELRPPGTFLIDTMDNEADLLYGGMPERLYIIIDGNILYAGKKGPMGYKLNEVRDWLENHRAKVE